MYGKPLAYTVKVGEIREIPKADKIEIATVKDYTVVVKKGEFKTGDLAIYVEVGSILPDGLEHAPEHVEKLKRLKSGEEGADLSEEARNSAIETILAKSQWPQFEFLRDKKFKIKNWCLNKFGIVSQGILFKPEDLEILSTKEDDDWTEKIGVKEMVEDEEEAGLAAPEEERKKKLSWWKRKLCRWAFFRKIFLPKKISETWDPSFPEKSDEENVQKIYTKMFEAHKDECFVKTEKLEGQNLSIFTEMVEKHHWFRKPTREKEVSVCSRTRRLSRNGTGKKFWDTVIRLGYDQKVLALDGEWWFRGEHCGPGIQGNIYKLLDTDVIFFDVYRKEKYEDRTNGDKIKTRWVKLPYEEAKAKVEEAGLKFVPVLDEFYKLPESTVNDKGIKVSGADIMLQESDKNTVFGNNLQHKSEGFVLRLKSDSRVSFKVKNPNYSI